MNYVPTTEEQQQQMLAACGVGSVDELFADIPANLAPSSFDLPTGISEQELTDRLVILSQENRADLLIFTGGGFYDHFIPSAVDALAGRSEFFTAYTPYQPERSQGTLQAIYEYQSQICQLTGMDAANASLYDGGTALYEACKMAAAATGRSKVLVDGAVNPLYREMLKAHLSVLAIEVVECAPKGTSMDREAIRRAIDESIAAVVVQNPSFFGVCDDHSDLSDTVHTMGGLLIQAVYPLALGILKSPGEMGVDIATGEGQSLGLPLSFGGPYLGILATRRDLVRRMPGRIAGRTVDHQGREGFVLTLQAREQHIRREKATSNICTNQGLCALRAHIYISLLGSQGLRDTARLCAAKAAYARSVLSEIPGLQVDKQSVFNEFVITLPTEAENVLTTLVARGIAAGLPLGRFYPSMKNSVLVAVTERRTREQIDRLARELREVLC